MNQNQFLPRLTSQPLKLKFAPKVHHNFISVILALQLTTYLQSPKNRSLDSMSLLRKVPLIMTAEAKSFEFELIVPNQYSERAKDSVQLVDDL